MTNNIFCVHLFSVYSTARMQICESRVLVFSLLFLHCWTYKNNWHIRVTHYNKRKVIYSYGRLSTAHFGISCDPCSNRSYTAVVLNHWQFSRTMIAHYASCFKSCYCLYLRTFILKLFCCFSHYEVFFKTWIRCAVLPKCFIINLFFLCISLLS